MKKRKPFDQPGLAEQSKYGFTAAHDKILDNCIANYGTCPFGCTKDGAPNCYFNAIIERRCAPSKM